MPFINCPRFAYTRAEGAAAPPRAGDGAPPRWGADTEVAPRGAVWATADSRNNSTRMRTRAHCIQYLLHLLVSGPPSRSLRYTPSLTAASCRACAARGASSLLAGPPTFSLLILS